MGGKIKLFEEKDIVLTEDVLAVKGEEIPVKGISSFEILDSGVGAGRAKWIAVILIVAVGYSVLWLCAGENSSLKLDNMTGIFCLGIVVFSVIVVMRSLNFQPEGKVRFVIMVGDRRMTVLNTKDMEMVRKFEECLRKAIEISKS